MIAMSMMSAYDGYRPDAIACAPVYSTHAHPLGRMAMRVLGMIRLRRGLHGGRAR